MLFVSMIPYLSGFFQIKFYDILFLLPYNVHLHDFEGR